MENGIPWLTIKVLDMKIIVRYTFIILSLVLIQNGWTQTIESSGSLTKHIIVAVDDAGIGSRASNLQIGRAIRQMLDTLYQEGDYLSLVRFRFNPRSSSVRGNYCHPLFASEDMEYFCRPLNNEVDLIRIFIENWSRINVGHSETSDGWSLLSISKPYLLSEVGRIVGERQKAVNKESDQNECIKQMPRVSRTYLIRVTDHNYNGNDFYEEIKDLYLMQRGDRRVQIDQIRTFTSLIERYYYMAFINETKINTLYVGLYEFQPHQQNFTLPSAVKYAPVARAKREKGGKYKIELTIGPQDNPEFNIDKIEINVGKGDSMEIQRYENLDYDQNISFSIPKEMRSRIKTVNLKAWLQLVDGFYNCTQMNPEEFSPIFLGKKGLNAKVPIYYDEEAHLFGCSFLPFPDWLWIYFLDDQQKAALWTDFLLILLMIAVLIIVYFRIRKYHPKTQNIHIVIYD